MKLEISFLLLIFVLFSHTSFSQIYFGDNDRQLGTFNIESCTYEYYTYPGSNTRVSYERSFPDIALHPDGKLYTISSIEEEFGLAIYELDLVRQRVGTRIKVLPIEKVSSLVCDQDGIFYFGYRQLHSYDPKKDVFKTYGFLPPGKRLAGDLAFYNGQLYGGVQESSNPYNGEILKIQIAAPQSSETYIDLPDSLIVVGLTNRWSLDCQSTFLIGNSFSRTEDLTQVYTIDIPNQQIEEICVVDLPGSSVFWGLTSSDEFRTNCSLQLDLDRNNSSGRLLDHFQIDSFCTVDFTIADVDLSIKSDYDQLDSMTIEVAEGVRHPGQEVLFIPTDNNLTIYGRGSTKLILVNNGNAEVEDFEAAISKVRFQLQATPAINGERQINCLLYAAGLASDTAKAFIQVTLAESPSAGQDTYVEACDKGPNITLFNEIGGNPRAGGYWSPPLFQNGQLFNAYNDTSGIYHYIVQEGNCPADSAAITVFKREAPPIGILGSNQLTETVTTCPGDTLVWDVSIPNALEYFWIDNYQGAVRPLVEERQYIVEVIDEFNCAWLGITTVVHENIETIETVPLCNDEVFPWKGIVIENDTLLCEIFQTTAGCDSTHCFQITFQPNFQRNESWRFCEGEERDIQGLLISRDTSFCTTYLASNGCDSIICSTVIFEAAIENSISINLCEGDAYFLGNQILTETGNYEALLSTSNGCDSLILLSLQVNPNVTHNLDTFIYEGEELVLGNKSFKSSGQYEVLLHTQEGCDSLVVLNLEVEPLPPMHFFTPTLINPNNQGWGKVFTIYSRLERQATIKQLVIYDAQGRLVFKTQNIAVGDESQAWRGINPTEPPGPSAVYFFTATVEDHFGRQHHLANKLILIH